MQTTIFPGVIDISNAATAIIRGIESEGAMRVHAGDPRPVGTWRGSRRRTTTTSRSASAASPVDVAGHRLSNAPEWSGRLWLEWSGAIGDGARLSVRADARSQSTVYFTPFNDAIQRQRSVWPARRERGTARAQRPVGASESSRAT